MSQILWQKKEQISWQITHHFLHTILHSRQITTFNRLAGPAKTKAPFARILGNERGQLPSYSESSSQDRATVLG
jgi:hypothetical protein